jgi:hypothetical protein
MLVKVVLTQKVVRTAVFLGTTFAKGVLMVGTFEMSANFVLRMIILSITGRSVCSLLCLFVWTSRDLMVKIQPIGLTRRTSSEYYQTPLYQRIRIASFHMEGDVLIWFQDVDDAGQFPTWEAFLQALLTRFGPTYDDPMESLMRLRQVSSMTDYTSQFEALSNRLSYFLTGLKDDIRLPVRMLHPPNLVAAFGLAKLQEEYPLTSRWPLRSASTTFSFGRQHS